MDTGSVHSMSDSYAAVLDDSGHAERLSTFLTHLLKGSELGIAEIARRAHLSRSFLYLLMDDDGQILEGHSFSAGRRPRRARRDRVHLARTRAMGTPASRRQARGSIACDSPHAELLAGLPHDRAATTLIAAAISSAQRSSGNEL